MLSESLGRGSLKIVTARSVDAVGGLDVPVRGEIGEDLQRNTCGHSFADEAVAQGVGRGSLDAGSLAEGAPGPGDAPSACRRSSASPERGWRLGLRFDPMIWAPGYRDQYRRLFAAVFSALPPASIHSVSVGGFRLPKAFYERIWRQYSDERLSAAPLERRDGMVELPAGLEAEMLEFCRAELRRHVPEARLFQCG